jgi:plastocyanin
MTSRKPLVIAAALGSVAGLALAIQVRAGGDKVAFPENYAAGILYDTVDRYDVKQYREQYATPVAVEVVRTGQPIPSGTVITMVEYKAQVDAQGKPIKDANGHFVKGDLIDFAVMEKRSGWGAEYPDNIRNGEWEYQSFTADGKINDKANLTACFNCHKPHADQDFVISLASLKGTVPRQVAAAPPPGPGVVSIANYQFVPNQVTVAAGQSITWVNSDTSLHQLVITGKAQKTPILLTGQSAQLTITEPGVYEYVDGLHPSVKGKIEVK